MKSMEDIRRDNLKLLIDEAGSQAKLSVLSGLPPSYISQVHRGVLHSTGGRSRQTHPLPHAEAEDGRSLVQRLTLRLLTDPGRQL